MASAAALYAVRCAGGIVREQQDEPYRTTGIHQRHDRGYKHLLSSKHIFLQLVRTFMKRGWVDHIDESHLFKVDKSFVLPDFSGKEADLVYRLKLKERDFIFYMLIEMQSTVDQLMPWRLLLYQVEIWRQVMKDAPSGQTHALFRLPAIIPIVLYNGSAPWTAPLAFRDMLTDDQSFEPDTLLNFSYVLIDVQRYRPEQLEDIANVIGSVFLIDRNTHLNVDEMMELFKRLSPVIDGWPEQQRGLFATWFEHILRRLIKTQDREFIIKSAVASIHKKGMSPVISNMIKNIDWLEEQAVLRGLERGIEQGVQQGKEQGIKRGFKKATEAVALNMLRKGLDVGLIAEVTGLSGKRIERLRQHYVR